LRGPRSVSLSGWVEARRRAVETPRFAFTYALGQIDAAGAADAGQLAEAISFDKMD
jgi:hypothetical protein